MLVVVMQLRLPVLVVLLMPMAAAPAAATAASAAAAAAPSAAASAGTATCEREPSCSPPFIHQLSPELLGWGTAREGPGRLCWGRLCSAFSLLGWLLFLGGRFRVAGIVFPSSGCLFYANLDCFSKMNEFFRQGGGAYVTFGLGLFSLSAFRIPFLLKSMWSWELERTAAARPRLLALFRLRS